MQWFKAALGAIGKFIGDPARMPATVLVILLGFLALVLQAGKPPPITERHLFFVVVVVLVLVVVVFGVTIWIIFRSRVSSEQRIIVELMIRLEKGQIPGCSLNYISRPLRGVLRAITHDRLLELLRRLR
jgi:hypothetical protein